MLKKLLIACVIAFLSTDSYAAILKVPTDYPTIQLAIDLAQL